MLFSGVLSTSALPQDALPIAAFPGADGQGAEGFGATSVGGRGGRVIEVVNLNDDGPGSLRAAVQAEGKRTVVFRISGAIELRSEFLLVHPYITIAGQTAPGQGITLTTHPTNPRSALTIKSGAHDVIVRYLRIRPSPPTARENLLVPRLLPSLSYTSFAVEAVGEL
jgi:hypothetical protein